MKIDIPMPSYSESMEEADLIGWLVAPGDFVHEGDPIAEIETDKATGELESPASGKLLEICVPEGTTGVKVGKVVARLEADEAASKEPSPQEAKPESEPEPTPQTTPEPDAAESAPAPSAEPTQEPEQQIQAPEATTESKTATALARRLAGQAGIDLGQIEGTGSRGRIMKADVEAASPGRSASVATSSSIAVLDVECRVDHALEVCQQLSAREPDLEIGLVALVARAAGQALREVPGMGTKSGEESRAPDIRVQSADDVARILSDADRKSLAVLSRELTVDPDPQAPLPSIQILDLSSLGIRRVQWVPEVGVALALGMGAPQGVESGEGPQTVIFTLGVETLAIEMGAAARWLFAFRRRIEEPLDMLL